MRPSPETAPALRPRGVIAALSGAAITAALVVAPGTAPAVAATGAAPGAPGTASTWVPGDKDGFGTARGVASKVWYTLSRGKLSDVYYPRIDTPSVRDSQFVVTDGKTFTDREDSDARSRVQLLSSRSLTYRLVTTARSGDWRITKTFVTDPADRRVLEKVRFESLTGKPLRLFLLHDPALDMTGNDDIGEHRPRRVVALPRRLGGGERGRLQPGHDPDLQRVPRDERRLDGPAVGPPDGLGVQRRPARATSCRRGELPLTGLRGHRSATVAIGVRLDDRSRAVRRPGIPRHRLRVVACALRRGLEPLPRARSAPHRRAWAVHHGVERVGHGAGGQRGQDLPRWVRRRSRSPVGLGELASGPRRLPRGLVA